MFYNNLKKEAIQRLKNAESRYESLGNTAKADVISLYETRKSAVKAIERVERYINTLANTPKEFARDMGYVKLEIKDFHEAIKIEEANASNNIKGAGTAFGGTVVGGAVASVGPTVAMAIATTFGTASTGTAIASLSGAAATNAALAWLGGGALAAGGGGMAAGNALLALAGPVGWGIAGGIAVIGGGFAMFKNKKAAEQANEEAKKVEQAIRELTKLISKVNALNNSCIKLKRALDLTMFVNTYPNDYLRFSSEQKSAMAALINNTRAMGKLINQRITE